MRRLRAHLFVSLLGASLGCSLAHIAHLSQSTGSERQPRAAIETCLSSIGMRDISDEWPYSEIIADNPDTLSAWGTPPPDSKWDLFFDTYKGALAWVQVSESHDWSVRFVKHDESFPPAFATCMSNLDPDVPVRIESDWYFDLS